MSTTTEELSKAIASLKTSRDLLKNALIENSSHLELHKALRDACIQRFEFCIELSWKVSMKVLGIDSKAPKIAIRDMAQNKLIDDVQMWFEFLLAHNKTSHTYDEEVAKVVYAEIEKSIPELDNLLFRLNKIS